MTLISERDLHDAARALTSTTGPQDCGIAPNAIRTFLTSASFRAPGSLRPLELDEMRPEEAMLYGIAVGAMAAAAKAAALR